MTSENYLTNKYCLTLSVKQVEVIKKSARHYLYIAKKQIYPAILAVYPENPHVEFLCEQLSKKITILWKKNKFKSKLPTKTSLKKFLNLKQQKNKLHFIQNNTDIKHDLIITGEEGCLLRNMLDNFGRLGLGQINTVINDVFWLGFGAVNDLCDAIKKELTGFESNTSWGIGCEEISDDFRIAFDIQQVVRHAIAWDRKPDGDITVDFGTPMQFSTTENLPIIRKV